MYHCHCETCRHANGASFATNLIVPKAQLTLLSGADTLSRYESSPQKFRYFCSHCGSPIYSHSDKSAHIVSVRAGTVDGDPGVRPSAHIWASSRAPWTELADGLPQRPEGLG
jgi:ADP-ribosyl-[dinitrogen reductase] hydrolase